MKTPHVIRRYVSSFILWCTLIALYLAILGTIATAAFYSWQRWWHSIHTISPLRAMVLDSLLFGLCLIAFLFVLTQPFIQGYIGRRPTLGRNEKRPETKD